MAVSCRTEPDLVVDYEYALAPELTLRTDEIDVPTAVAEVTRLTEHVDRSARSTSSAAP